MLNKISKHSWLTLVSTVVVLIVIIFVRLQNHESNSGYHEIYSKYSPDGKYDLVVIEKNPTATLSGVDYIYICRGGEEVKLDTNTSQKQAKIAGFYDIRKNWYYGEKDIIDEPIVSWVNSRDIILNYKYCRFKHIIPVVKFDGQEFHVIDRPKFEVDPKCRTVKLTI